jgi:hypothetical protein
MGYTLSLLLLLSTATVGISVAGLSAGLTVLVFSGMFLATALGSLGFVLMIAALVTSAVAFACLAAYGGTSGSLAVMRYITNLVFGPLPAQAHAQGAEPLKLAAPQAGESTNKAVTVSPLPPIRTSPVKKSGHGGAGDKAAQNSTSGPF